MNKNIPKVSIIITLYNCEKYIEYCLLSCINQTYKNIEIIVVNDGSTDNSKNIVEKFISIHSSIKLINKKNGGVSTALNLGIKNMTGDYFTWLSSDDLFAKNNVELKIQKFTENKKLQVVFSNYQLITNKSKFINKKCLNSKFSDIHDPLSMFLLRKINGCTMLFKRTIFEKCGFFDETLLTTQDYMFWYKILLNTSPNEWLYIDIPLIKTRIHSEQTTNTFSEIQKLNDDFWIYIIDDLLKNEIYYRIFISKNSFLMSMQILFNHNKKNNPVIHFIINNIDADKPKEKNSEFTKYLKYERISFVGYIKINLINLLTWLKKY